MKQVSMEQVCEWNDSGQPAVSRATYPRITGHPRTSAGIWEVLDEGLPVSERASACICVHLSLLPTVHCPLSTALKP